MKTSEFLLSLIDCYKGVSGRTLLQKRSFFVYVLSEIPVNLDFDAHFYGPYSASVDGTITQLKNLGFIQESSTGFGPGHGGFEMRRYDYSLTEDGNSLVAPIRQTEEYSRIDASIKKIKTAGDPNYVELSIAAKAYFILKRKNKGMTTSELSKEAARFNWEVSPESIKKAVNFLNSVGLTTSNK